VARKNGRLTRADLEKIVNAMSAGDVFRAQGAPEEQKAMVIFNSAASRLDYGDNAVDRVPIADTAYLGEQLQEALNMGGPKAEDTEASPVSADTGDSAPS
jgi:hypothetical protein